MIFSVPLFWKVKIITFFFLNLHVSFRIVLPNSLLGKEVHVLLAIGGRSTPAQKEIIKCLLYAFCFSMHAICDHDIFDSALDNKFSEKFGCNFP